MNDMNEHVNSKFQKNSVVYCVSAGVWHHWGSGCWAKGKKKK